MSFTAPGNYKLGTIFFTQPFVGSIYCCFRRMKLLVYEFITGGGLNSEPLPPSLAQEGDLMLQALLQDLSLLPDIEIFVFRDARLSLPFYGENLHVLPVPEGGNMLELFASWALRCDAVWPIAPETGGILLELCECVQTMGKQLLTSPTTAVRIGGDKLRTFELLQRHGIPAVPTQRLTDRLPARHPRWVVKARDGVGCGDSTIIENDEEYCRVKAALSDPDNFILQPFTLGESASLSCLFKYGEASLLSYNRQQIAVHDACFELLGCIVNAPCSNWERYRQLASRVAEAMPELWGYAGLDLLDTPEGPLLLEINPRLTTSYAGLRQALQRNIAQYVVNLPYAALPPSIQQGQAVTVTIPKENSNGG